MINYKILSESQEYYKECGYVPIEVPWSVTKEISGITTPPDKLNEFNLVHKNNKILLGSGEQAFLYQISKGYLPYGNYQTITPCFRFENHDVFHQKCFMKNELIEFSDKPIEPTRLEIIVEVCHNFFRRYLDGNLTMLTIKPIYTKNGKSYDINLEDIELGSYGIRNHMGIHWLYATGVAEPRFSKALKYYGISQN